LIQPSAASAAERNWSIYGNIKSRGKNQMKHETGDKLVYLYESYRIANKFGANYKPEVQPWDGLSDSDSDCDDPLSEM
jgi:hypothetical protein